MRIVVTIVALLALAAPCAGQTLKIKKKTDNTTQTVAPADGASESAQASAADQAFLELARWQPTDAREILKPQRPEPTSSAEIESAWGYLRAEEGATSDALDVLARASELDPTDPKPMFLKGEVLYYADRSGDAQTAWRAARDRGQSCLANDADDAEAAYFVGAARVRLKETAAAREALDKAASLGFDPALVAYQVGLSYAIDKKLDDAMAALSDAIAADPELAHAYFWRGLTAQQLGKTDRMLSDLETFVAKAPDAPEAAKARTILQAAGR